MAGNLFSTVMDRVVDPDSSFAVTSSSGRWSYADMADGSGRYANLLTELGIGRGDRVAVQTAKHLDCILLYLACLRIGAVYLPLNTSYTGAEIDYFLADAEPGLFVRDPAAADEPVRPDCRAETIGGDGQGSLQRMAGGMSPAFETVSLSGDDLAAILYTSGTTGRSKGAMITHENLRSNALALVDCWRFTSRDVLLHALPIYHTHGLFVATNTVLLSGASMIFLDRFDPASVIGTLAGASVMMGVPTFYSRLLADRRFTREAAAHMRLFISGSAPLPAEVHRRFRALTGHAILERYGMTETNMITSNPYDGERRPGTVGFPLPGIEVRIADPQNGRPLPRGEVGVIELRGPNVFKGYWRMPDKTEAEFRGDGFFVTGDLGYVDADGYFVISGRQKDLIISGGLNVYPAEIENALDALPEIAESAVIGLPHADLGEAVTAVVVARAGSAIDEMAVRKALQPVLAGFKLPKRVVTRGELPRNAMGKVQKNQLRVEFAALYTD